MILQTPRLLLRPWRAQDAPRLRELTFDPGFRQHSVMFQSPLSLEEATQLCQRLAHRERPELGRWAIEQQGLVIGNAALQPQRLDGEEQERIELGYRLQQASWGQGLATEASRLLLAHADRIGLNQVHAFIEPANLRSQAVARRLGMCLQGEASFQQRPVEVWTI